MVSVGYEWVSPDSGSVKFRYCIEDWLRDTCNTELFQAAFGGDQHAYDWLPHWVAQGIDEMKEKMK